MNTTYDKVLNWYKGQPWWGKVLFFGVLLVPVLIFLVSNFSSLVLGTGFIPPKKISISPPFGKANEAIDVRIEELKQELTNKLETVRQTGVRALERRDAISKATTMAELDELKKRYGL